jgi:hypothetical protein
MVYDIGDEDRPVIQARDVIRAFKRLGLSSIEPHMHLIFKAGGVKPEDQRVYVEQFNRNFMI